jgi:hypothetical protein
MAKNKQKPTALPIASVKVGAVVYGVEYVGKIKHKDKQGNEYNPYGDVNYGKRRIRVSLDDNDEQMQTSVVWHEAMHALLYQAGWHDTPEGAILALEYALPQFLRDNPELVKRVLETT